MVMADKPRWADISDDDDYDIPITLPAPVVEGPDENDIKRVIEYKLDEKGRRVKVTTTIQVRKITITRLSKDALERLSWGKFGDAVNDDPSSRLTMVSTEEIFIERPRPPGASQDVEPVTVGGSLEAKASGTLMMCRKCNKKCDHWTVRCPYNVGVSVDDNKLPTTESAPAPAPALATTGKYVPPRARPGAPARLGKRYNDEYSVRVNNLSEDASSADLQELFGNFRAISRANVVCDKITRLSRGFGFVDFFNKEDAQRAIDKLNGYGYDNLILRVDWAAPRAPK